MEVSGQLHALAALPPGKELPLPTDRRLGGLQSQCGHCREGEILTPARIRTMAVQPAAHHYIN
jgi:hypothetical protein